MSRDKMQITILEDGTIKMDSDRISMPNHSSAEQFVRAVAREAGGSTTKKSKHKHGHLGHHSHEGEHEHH